MKKQPITAVLLTVIIFLMMGSLAFAQKTQTAAGWLKSKKWSNSIKLKLHPSVNTAEFYKQYHANKAVWDKAFLFTKENDLDTISVGKHIIDGDNAYASITEAPSKELDKASWESHQKYIDLQYVIRGKEQIAVVPIGMAKVTKPYDAAKDVANYTAEGTFYTANPGTFFLFFPEDVHRPNIKVAGFDVVKKMVIKIKVAK
jgi:biofilm protein TabA